MQNINVKSLDSFDISVIFTIHIKKIYGKQTSPPETKFNIIPEQLSIRLEQTTNRTTSKHPTNQQHFGRTTKRRLRRKK